MTEILRSYGATTKAPGNARKEETGRWLNNRAEKSHLPFRRQGRTMLRFRRMRRLQKFVAVHASIHNLFNKERHRYSRDNFKLQTTAVLSKWRQLYSVLVHVFSGKLRLVRIRLTPPQGALVGGVRKSSEFHGARRNIAWCHQAFAGNLAELFLRINLLVTVQEKFDVASIGD